MREEESEDKELASERRALGRDGWTPVRSKRVREFTTKPEGRRYHDRPRGFIQKTEERRYQEPPRRGPRPERKFRNDYRNVRKETSGRPKPKRTVECWECGQEGHFARECPYIFRRQRPEQRTYAQAAQPEPMEVNATRLRKKNWRWESSGDSDWSTTSGEESRERRPAERRTTKERTGRTSGEESVGSVVRRKVVKSKNE